MPETSMPEPATATRVEQLTYMQAVVEATRWGLETFPESIVFGEDLGLPGGPFGSTKGLRKDFGERVFDTPISEAAILGAAIGAGMRGMRPIVEIMYGDFFLVAFDQVVNQAANVRYVSRGKYQAPITIRSQSALTPGACAQHAQSLEAFFAHTPGLRVALPGNPRDAYELLRTAIACDDPVVVIESRALYAAKDELTLDGPLEPLGGARVLRPGKDVTVVSWSRLAGEALAAAELVAPEGIDAEVIDLRWLNPLDFEAVAESLARTTRLLVAHEANLTGGFGAELAARAASECFWNLDVPVARVALPDLVVPAAPVLQEAVFPGVDAIAEALRRLSRL
jgi:acetoin:2,6-dichlorophenolindophenol oxidoreductase subunit beta